MSLKSLKAQLLRDLQASWRKTALLALLLIVGLVVWIPPLIRAMGRAAEPADPTAAAGAGTPSVQELLGTDAPEAPAESAGHNWQSAERLLATDPLVIPAEDASLPRDPFRVDVDQFPLPVLIAEEPPAPKAVATVIEVRTPPPQLTLVSTIIGANRRAAYINNRLCFEGSQFRAGGETLTVVSIAPRRVVVRRGGDEFELKIAARDWTAGEPSDSVAGP